MAERRGLFGRTVDLLRRTGRHGAPPQASGLDPLSPRTAPPDVGHLARIGIPLPAVQRSRSVEEFRVIKRNLLRAWSQEEAGGGRPSGRSIMVASARPGEGKSFVALNLALAFAAEEEGEALVVDTDTSHPLLESFFGRRAEAGLVDVLEGRRGLADVILATSHPKLSILPAGRGAPHVPELLASRRMAALLAEMAEHRPQRIIVIDTAPCLVSSDAPTLAAMVAQIVFVVEAHRTQHQEIEAALALLGGCRHISLLLNKTDKTASQHFGSYGYYYLDRESDEPPATERG